MRNFSDLPVLAFVKCLISLHYSKNCLKYTKDPRVLEKISNFKVNMGFGLHTGWAIEGAIGS